MRSETKLNCSVGIGISRLIAKVSSAKAKPNGVLWVVPGQEAKFLAPLDVRDIPGVGKVTEQNLNALGIRQVGDLSRFEDAVLEEKFGKWGLALAGKSRGEDAGGWFDNEVGADGDVRSISHEHTYNEDTANVEQIESTLMRLSEMVGRRLREAGLHARTIQLKLRYKDFTTITQAHSLPFCHPTRHRNLRASTFAVSQELEEGNSGPAAGCTRLGFRICRRPGESSGGRPPRALAKSPFRRRPPAR